MILFYYGPDIQRVRQKTNETIQRYRTKYAPGFNLFILDFSQSDHQATLEQALKNTSFFPETKLLVIKGATHHDTLPETLIHLIKDNQVLESKDIVVIFHEEGNIEELKKNNKEFFNFLTQKSNQSISFPLLESSNLAHWIKRECEAHEASIDPQAIRKLIQLIGNDTLLLEHEIEKLSNYTQGRLIVEQDVEQLVTTKIILNIFDFIDALATRNKERAFVLLQKELGEGRDAHYLLAMMNYQFRTLLTVKDLVQRGETMQTISKKAGLAPFVGRKAFQQAQKFDLSTLRFIYQALLELDTQTKEGRIDLPLALSQFVLRV